MAVITSYTTKYKINTRMLQVRQSKRPKEIADEIYDELSKVFDSCFERKLSDEEETDAATHSSTPSSTPSIPCLELTYENVYLFKENHFRKKLRLSSSSESPTQRSQRPIRIHVYAGGESGNMCGPFSSALSESGLEHKGIVKVAYKYKKEFNNKTAKELISWLLCSDVHFFLTHPIQAMYGWNCDDLFPLLEQLRDHPGWPSGDQISCPIFTQDKYEYLSALPTLTNPTLKVMLPFNSSDQNYSHTMREIREFVAMDYKENEGFVVKPPFETNCGPHLLKFCKQSAGVDAVFRAVEMLSGNCYPRLPYVMIQPTMRNRKEYKVVLFNGKYQYVNYKPKTPTHSHAFSYEPHERLRRFAEYAVSELKVCCPGAITDGLVRVDVFQTATKSLVVNEFESLEAVYYHHLQHTTTNQLVEYWIDKIKTIVEMFF
jgi:hypothetical protein